MSKAKTQRCSKCMQSQAMLEKTSKRTPIQQFMDHWELDK